MPTGFDLGYMYIEALDARQEAMDEAALAHQVLEERDQSLHEAERRLRKFLSRRDGAILVRGRVFYLDADGDLMSAPEIKTAAEFIDESELEGEPELHEAERDGLDDMIAFAIESAERTPHADDLPERMAGSSGVRREVEP